MSDTFPTDHPFEYEVIGEHLADPLRLLTIDGDGRLFEFNLGDGTAAPAELTADWVVDVIDAALYQRQVAGGLPHSHALVIG